MALATISPASHSHGVGFTVSSPAGAMAPMVSEADVILPPPTACNPIPSLPAALRLDNREQFLQVLQESSSLRQLLVFEDDALRTLLLRQVINDPKTHANNSATTNKQTKKNWDTFNVFHYPKSLQPSIVGTRLVNKSLPRTTIATATNHTGGSTILSMTAGGGGTEVSIHPPDKDDADLLGETTLAAGQHVDVVLYFVRPCQLATTQTLVTRIPRWKHVKHRLFYLPQPSALVHQILVDSGLVANPSVEISSLQLDLFPLESDVISMEYPNALQEATLEGTPSTLITTCARAILKLQDVIGIIPRIQALGPLGEDVLSKSLHMAVDEYLQRADTQLERPLINPKVAMMILDRQVDMITPLVTPLTYEGLLDEVVGIENGFLQLPLQTLNPEEEPASSTTVVALGVHAGDTLYAEVRDQHVEKFGSFLQNQAKALQESHANFTNKGTKKDLNEIHQFVKQIPMFTQNLRSLTNHIHIAELIKAHTEQVTFREQWQTERSIIEGESCYDMLEEWICSNHPISKVLRGLCLLSLCSGGVRANRYDNLRALIVQGYGYEYLLKLHDLERLGWIRRKDTLWMDSTSSAFATLRKSLILIHAEVDTVEPDDIAYVTSGYAPLSVRLIQAAMQGWTKTRAELLKELPGRLVDIQQSWPPVEFGKHPIPRESLGDFAKETTTNHHTSTTPAATATTTTALSIKPTLLVFFVGGISYAEIAALRFLSKRPTFPFHIIMITTKIINGNTMLQQTME